jgi:hypothetical protein
MFFLPAREVLRPNQMIPEKKDGGFRAGPLQIAMANVRARGALACPCRFLGAFDHTAGGHTILDPRETGDSMHRVEPA